MNFIIAIFIYVGAFVVTCFIMLMMSVAYILIRDKLQIRKAKKLAQLPLYEQKAYEARKYEETK